MAFRPRSATQQNTPTGPDDHAGYALNPSCMALRLLMAGPYRGLDCRVRADPLQRMVCFA